MLRSACVYDGVEIRALCERLGIEKRHSSPYHPQGDGLVERSIGLAKQVARCLTLDRKLSKESWPEILPEVSLYKRGIQAWEYLEIISIISANEIPFLTTKFHWYF